MHATLVRGGRGAQWGHDVRHVLGRLLGRSAPTFTSAPVPLAEADGSRTFVVSKVKAETADTVSLFLRPADGAPCSFLPGQFYNLEIAGPSGTLRRNYSVSSAPGSLADGVPMLAFTIKRVAGGAASTRLTESVVPGHTLRLRGPYGQFVWNPEEFPSAVFLAGGSGITPVFSMLSAFLGSDQPGAAYLLYGSRSRQDAIFADALDELCRAHPHRLQVRQVFEHGAPDSDPVRRLTAANVESYLTGLGSRITGEAAVFVCGPEGMRDEARQALARVGIASSRVREERFTSGVSAGVSLTPQLLTLRNKRGDERQVSVVSGETLLEAAERSGLRMPYSCAMGGCGACRVKLVSGDVSLPETNCLSEAERAAGYTLPCVARPLGPCVVES
jgi:ring-1,2-phenylacetyl-CoA epoxidase subunit PaaE